MIEPDLMGLLQQYLDTYGPDQSTWPARQQKELSDLLKHNAQARELLSEAQELNRLLGQYTLPEAERAVQASIIDAIPPTTPGLADQLLNWLFPARKENLWHTALAVTLPLLFGFFLGQSFPASEASDTPDNWEEDIYLAGFQDTGDSER